VIDHPDSAVQACRALHRPHRDISIPIVTSTKPKAAPEGAAPPDFERSLAELETIVDKLEQGELSLDESLQQFERGVQLTRVCQTALKQAEHKVEVLLRKSGQGQNPAGDPAAQADEFEAAPFEPDAADR